MHFLNVCRTCHFEHGHLSNAGEKNWKIRLVTIKFVKYKFFLNSRHLKLFSLNSTLSWHCVKSVRIRSCSGSYFPAFVLNTDQSNSEHGHFLCSVRDWVSNQTFLIFKWVEWKSGWPNSIKPIWDSEKVPFNS